MTRRARLGLVVGLAGAAALAAALAPPVPQDPAYHRMADRRALAGVPNAANVLSNLPFVLVGALGLGWLARRPAPDAAFSEARERWPYGVFFSALALTGLGSAYYHLAPGTARLVWDRLPLAAALMALLAAIFGERIGARIGVRLLAPLVALGVASVLHWYAGELRGQGDLRLYGLVQLYPLLAIPVMAALFAPRYTGGPALITAVALYGVAKVFEALDAPIFAVGSVVSGHTLKHLTAALSGYWILRMLRTRVPTLRVLTGPGLRHLRGPGNGPRGCAIARGEMEMR